MYYIFYSLLKFHRPASNEAFLVLVPNIRPNILYQVDSIQMINFHYS